MFGNLQSPYFAAINKSQWGGSANCGRCVQLEYQGKCVQLMLVDQCPGCGPNHLDLSHAGFKALAPLYKGIVDSVQWFFLDECPDYLLQGSNVPIPQPMCGSGGTTKHPMAKISFEEKLRKRCRRRKAKGKRCKRQVFEQKYGSIGGFKGGSGSGVGNGKVPRWLEFKDGSSQWWMGLQAANVGNAVKSLSVRGPDGRVFVGKREDYNYFIFHGGAGPGPFTVKINLVNGLEMVAAGIKLQASGKVYF